MEKIRKDCWVVVMIWVMSCRQGASMSKFCHHYDIVASGLLAKPRPQVWDVRVVAGVSVICFILLCSLLLLF